MGGCYAHDFWVGYTIRVGIPVVPVKEGRGNDNDNDTSLE